MEVILPLISIWLDLGAVLLLTLGECVKV